MKKSQFTQLKRNMQAAPIQYLHMVGGKVYMSEGHFIVWVPAAVYLEHVAGEQFPALADGEKASRSTGNGWRFDGGIDSRAYVEKALRMQDTDAASYTGFMLETDEGHILTIWEAPRAVVRLAHRFHKMAADLCGVSRVYGSDHKSPLWFYSPACEGLGAMVLPCNYNHAEQLAQLESLYRAAGGSVTVAA